MSKMKNHGILRKCPLIPIKVVKTHQSRTVRTGLFKLRAYNSPTTTDIYIQTEGHPSEPSEDLPTFSAKTPYGESWICSREEDLRFAHLVTLARIKYPENGGMEYAS
jgi:hypothetical protein